MTVVIRKEPREERCWACGQRIGDEEVFILISSAMGAVYLHPDCAQTLSRKLLSDYVDLVDLGYVVRE